MVLFVQWNVSEHFKSRMMGYDETGIAQHSSLCTVSRRVQDNFYIFFIIMIYLSG